MQDVTHARPDAMAAPMTARVDAPPSVPPDSPEFPIAGDRLNEPTMREPKIPEDSPGFPISGDRLNGDCGAAGRESELSVRQLAAIELLVLGKATGAVARELDIDRKTLFNWRKLECFDRGLNRRRRELWDAAGLRVGSMVQRSLDVMEAELYDPYDRSRFRAATVILRLSNISKSVRLADDRENG